ncbi:Swarming motility protein SwrB [Bacillus sonorensis]|uniref:DUF6115 domain-containing protein n=1 Tax=Bacillus sonorensis TaxID=119858 RepID=UPI000497AAC8|nr:hypothetical protein [Bacillus sonorensis]MBG9917137.1 Swarming motility protein SwrB [Bacillus sonorensis]MCF7618846.1 Swarming motility protein SwrB [Bacillus sonorensis]MCY7855210.1 Swarming motility protein SwrB [Bacillus sonorensis]MCY8024846.1 Swarming motility protein SwrB [Bacillus sonorensis]MCY8032080.1 Swarming motility protein SwrB [Bacillus sonorensis]
MSTILWLASFMLHGILIYFVIILYMRLGAFKDAEKKQKQLLEETENTLTAFLIELKDENEKLVRDLQQAEKRGPQQADKHQPDAPDESDAERAEAKETDDLPLHIESMIDEVERAEDELNQEERGDSDSLEEKAAALHEQGFSPEEIARRLKSGKTEIELLLKFRGKLKNDS